VSAALRHSADPLVPKPAVGVQVARFGTGSVLYDEPRARLHVLDEMASLVWQCFDGATSTDEIVIDLVDVLGAEEHEARTYVDALVTSLLSRDDLATRSNVSAPAPSPEP
jgi:hypothetical protein